MPARTPEELTGDLDASLAWRRAELTVIRGDVQKAAKTGGAAPRERMLLRAAVVLLYAHWEGFLREACQGYLDYVARLRLKYTELSRPLAQTAIKQLAARTVDRHDESLEALTEAVLSVTARARMSRKNVVDTRGSLDYDALERILEALGIETSVFVTKRSLIDHSLCGNRHAIAHGRDRYPTAERVDELYREVLTMMESARDLLSSAAWDGAYRA